MIMGPDGLIKFDKEINGGNYIEFGLWKIGLRI